MSFRDQPLFYSWVLRYGKQISPGLSEMCGIAGIIQPPGSAVRKARLSAMLMAIRHRGPDGYGIWQSDNVGLAHARLSIIDPEGGAQPMGNPDGDVQVCFNGEIYNYQELRHELEAYGHVFVTHSDTEVILQAWREWGESFVGRLRGMFAFAIVDLSRRGVFMARDHLGIKPLLWARWDGGLAFASEINALLALPDCPRAVDLAALDDYLRLGFIPAPRSAWAAIRKLLPGHCAWVPLADPSAVHLRRYWSLSLGDEPLPDETSWQARLDEALKDSVRAHLVADVPFGAFLSGGIDSTAIVGCMTELLARPVKTYAVGFDDPQFDELVWARRAASRYRTEHHEMRLGPDALAILPNLSRHYGEPFGDESAIPTYFVARLAREQVPMVLTGDGGDEAFLGYRRYSAWLSWLSPAPPPRPLWKRAIRPLLQRVMSQRFAPDIRARVPSHLEWASWIGGSNLSAAWHPEVQGLLPEPLLRYAQVAAQAGHGCPDEQFGQYLDYSVYLPDDLLTKVDIATMAHGLEARTPLVDVKIVELASQIPWHVSLEPVAGGERRGKALLKDRVRRDMGIDFTDRPKTGFTVPMQRWLNTKVGKEIRADLLGTSAQPRLAHLLQARSYSDVGVPTTELSRQDAKRCWRLLVLEEWLRQREQESWRVSV